MKQRITLTSERTIRVLIACHYIMSNENFLQRNYYYMFIYLLKLSCMHRYFCSSRWYLRIYILLNQWLAAFSLNPIFNGPFGYFGGVTVRHNHLIFFSSSVQILYCMYVYMFIHYIYLRKYFVIHVAAKSLTNSIFYIFLILFRYSEGIP